MPGLRPHHRRRLCGRPVAAAHIVVGHQQAPRGGQHQRHRDVGDRSRIRARAVADRDLAFRRGREIDAVIAGAVADDGAELRQQVHHVAAERRAARRDHRADVGELFGRRTLRSAACRRRPAVRNVRRCAASAPWESANRSGPSRALLFFLAQSGVTTISKDVKRKGRNRLPDSALVFMRKPQGTSRAACPARPSRPGPWWRKPPRAGCRCPWSRQALPWRPHPRAP